MSRFKENWLEFVRRNPGFVSLLLLGIVVAMFVVGSIMCGLNYNAGVLYGIELMESRIIECEGYVVNRNIRVTNYICDRIEFCIGDPDGEIYLRMYDGGTCWSPSQPYHMFLSQASTIVMSNFKGK